MKATTFTPTMLDDLNKTIKFAHSNRHSTFYREKYSSLNIGKIKSYDDFANIPFLLRKEFAEVNVFERTFVPQEEVSYYSSSSGTSTGIPLIIPHASCDYDDFFRYYFDKKLFEKLEIRTVLFLLSPNSVPLMKAMTMKNKGFTVIAGDINNLSLMAKIAKEVSIDAIVSTPTRLYNFITELKKIDFNLPSIKWISIGSELCPSTFVTFFKNQLPNAYIKIRYGNSEIGTALALRCHHLANHQKPEYFHPEPLLMEIVDNAGKTLPLGEIGEIVYTDLAPKAFPLIRYKTGDMGKIIQKNCECGNKHLLVFEGKKQSDFFMDGDKFISATNIGHALLPLQEYIEPHYKIEIIPNDRSDSDANLALHLTLKPAYDHAQEKIKIEIQKHIARSEKTDILHGLPWPPKIIFMKNIPALNKKAKYIINHDTSN